MCDRETGNGEERILPVGRVVHVMARHAARDSSSSAASLALPRFVVRRLEISAQTSESTDTVNAFGM